MASLSTWGIANELCSLLHIKVQSSLRLGYSKMLLFSLKLLALHSIFFSRLMMPHSNSVSSEQENMGSRRDQYKNLGKTDV